MIRSENFTTLSLGEFGRRGKGILYTQHAHTHTHNTFIDDAYFLPSSGGYLPIALLPQLHVVYMRDSTRKSIHNRSLSASGLGRGMLLVGVNCLRQLRHTHTPLRSWLALYYLCSKRVIYLPVSPPRPFNTPSAFVVLFKYRSCARRERGGSVWATYCRVQQETPSIYVLAPVFSLDSRSLRPQNLQLVSARGTRT